MISEIFSNSTTTTQFSTISQNHFRLIFCLGLFLALRSIKFSAGKFEWQCMSRRNFFTGAPKITLSSQRNSVEKFGKSLRTSVVRFFFLFVTADRLHFMVECGSATHCWCHTAKTRGQRRAWRMYLSPQSTQLSCRRRIRSRKCHLDLLNQHHFIGTSFVNNPIYCSCPLQTYALRTDSLRKLQPRAQKISRLIKPPCIVAILSTYSL